MRSSLNFFIFFLTCLWLQPASSHELDVVELLIQQTSSQEYAWSWVAKGFQRPALEHVKIHWPSGCEAKAKQLFCTGSGLQGKLSLDGLGTGISLVSLRILVPPKEHRFVLTQTQPSVWLQDVQPASVQGWGSRLKVTKTYIALGIEHILQGWDHLLFVIGLFLLVGAGLPLVGAITAFTAAHTTALAASALGWVRLPTGPVEACIALSIVLVCSEAMNSTNSWTKRMPYLAAFPFGLVHGLGFAGALTELGLPEWHFYSALLSFNLGVETGQMGVVLLFWVLMRKISVYAWAAAFRKGLLSLMGSVAAYWSIERVTAIF